MSFFKRKKNKKIVTQSNVKRNNESTTNDWLIHNTNTFSVISTSSDYSGYDSNYLYSCSSHASRDSGSSFDSSSSCS